jgi:hypothetical protein
MKNYYLYKEGNDGSELGKELENDLDERAGEISEELNRIFQKEIYHNWSRKDTWCYFFTDYPSHRKQWLIGTGEMSLASYLREKYYCVLFSNNYEDNFHVFDIFGNKGIIIRIDYLKAFISKFFGSSVTKLFFYDFTEAEIAKPIDNWRKGFETPGVVTIPVLDMKQTIEFLKQQEIHGDEGIEDVKNLMNSVNQTIIKNHNEFRKKLEEFHQKMKDNVSEKELQNFLADNMWIIDFKYLAYPKPKKEEPTEKGRIDILLKTKNQFGNHHFIVMELKKAIEDMAKTYDRGEKKPHLRVTVLNALSQAIHYIENLDVKPYHTKEGLVIIGRRDAQSEPILDALNARLHGIKVLTYDDLHDNALELLKTFETKYRM